MHAVRFAKKIMKLLGSNKARTSLVCPQSKVLSGSYSALVKAVCPAKFSWQHA
jgi:hypothetical protein